MERLSENSLSSDMKNTHSVLPSTAVCVSKQHLNKDFSMTTNSIFHTAELNTATEIASFKKKKKDVIALSTQKGETL